MTIPLVSIVVPTRNRAHLLPRLLHNLADQDLPAADGQFEIIVVDDASTDGTPHLLGGWSDRRVRVIRHHERTGVSCARNDGTAAARGRWVAWCDDDDLWAPDKLRLQLRALAEEPGSRWCNGGAVHVDSDLRVLHYSQAPPAGDLARTMLATNVVTGGGSGVVADRALVLELGGFAVDLSIYADWHLWTRLALASPLAAVDAPLVAYMDHADSMSHNTSGLLAEYERLESHLGLLGEGLGVQTRIDGRAVAEWILYQQVGAESVRVNLRLALDVLRRRMVAPVQAPGFLLRALAPTPLRVLRARSRRRQRSREPHFTTYEAMTTAWLPLVADEAMATTPAAS